MVKPITINATFKNEHQIFTCNPHEFVGKVAERYDIDMDNHELFVNKGGGLQKIKICDLADHMKIEIVPKSALSNGQRSLRSYFVANGAEKKQAKVDNIVTKLTKNSPLTGLERKDLIEWLMSREEASPSKKRKISDVETNSVKVFQSKKTQCNMSAIQTKDSFAQTDFVQIGENTEQDDEPITVRMKKLACSSNVDQAAIEKLMQESFEDRRNFIILKRPLIQVVRDNYPLLFSFQEVKNELDRLFYPGKYVAFIGNMIKYAKHILEACSPNDELYKMTQNSIQRASSKLEKTYARVVGSVFLLAKVLLKENAGFIHLTDSPSGSSDIYPHIEAPCSLEELFNDKYVFSIIAENQKLCEAPSFQEAILCLMATFFIFNINYPESNHRTLTVFEKLYLCANDSTDIDDLTAQMLTYLQLKT